MDSGRIPVSFDQAPPRVAVVFCSHDRVHAGFAYDYGHLIAHFTATQGYVPETGKYFSLSLNWCQTSMLADGRQKLVDDLKKKNVAKILWIDTDMRFPRNALQMLLRHDVPVVGVNYVARRPPFHFTSGTLENQWLQTKPDSRGLVEVGHIGFGFALTDISIFDDEPCFSFDWAQDETGAWKTIGEDVFFSRKMRAMGHKVYVDQELSTMIGHTGEFVFTVDEMAQVEAIA
jgi:hypothetical protein